MKEFSFSFIIDYIFVRVIIGLIAFAWCRYWFDGFWTAVAAAAIATVCLSIIIDVITMPRRKKRLERKKQEQLAQAVINQFCFNDLEFALNHLHTMLKKKYDAQKTERSVLVQNNQKRILVYPHFEGQKLTQQNLATMVADSRKHKPDKLLILCGGGVIPSAQAQAKQLVGFDIIFLDEFQIYRLLQKFDALPNIEIKTRPQKRFNLKEIKKLFINKKRIKGYFFWAVILLFSSYFVAYSLYYLIFASLLLALCLVCFFSSNQKEADDQTI